MAFSACYRSIPDAIEKKTTFLLLHFQFFFAIFVGNKLIGAS